MPDALATFAEKFTAFKGYTVKTAERAHIAKLFLKDSEEKSATVLLMALRTLYGVEALYWEPETIWLSLEREHGIDLPVEARDKIQAAISVIRNPIFYSDSLVFQRTVQAFNNELYDPESLQECHPAHMARAVYEANLLRGMDPEEENTLPELDEDVQQYVAVCLFRAGYVCPPDQLRETADNILKLLSKGQGPFVEEVKKSWANLNRTALLGHKFQETPLDVQLAQLASCHLYVTDQMTLLANDVLAIEKNVIAP